MKMIPLYEEEEAEHDKNNDLETQDPSKKTSSVDAIFLMSRGRDFLKLSLRDTVVQRVVADL